MSQANLVFLEDILTYLLVGLCPHFVYMFNSNLNFKYQVVKINNKIYFLTVQLA